jgi:hypothetical protein
MYEIKTFYWVMPSGNLMDTVAPSPEKAERIEAFIDKYALRYESDTETGVCDGPEGEIITVLNPISTIENEDGSVTTVGNDKEYVKLSKMLDVNEDI